jgi:hypothetical protein
MPKMHALEVFMGACMSLLCDKGSKLQKIKEGISNINQLHLSVEKRK